MAAGPPGVGERGSPTGGRLAAVLGSPIRHSLSPVLHAAAYDRLGLNWTYTAHEVDEAGLAGFVEALDERWAGLSLTMPLKRVAIPLCAEITPRALAVSAVNTLTFDPDGSLRGDNTDIPGLVGALRAAGVAPLPSAAILGGGATAASALAALSEFGVEVVAAYVRGPDRAREMSDLAEGLGVAVVTRDWADAARALDEPLVLVTTPAGAVDALARAVPGAPGVLFDVVYDPWPTPLAAAWSAAGGRVVGGLELLVHQAALQVELMTGQALDLPPLVAAMRAAGEAVLTERAAARVTPNPVASGEQRRYSPHFAGRNGLRVGGGAPRPPPGSLRTGWGKLTRNDDGRSGHARCRGPGGRRPRGGRRPAPDPAARRVPRQHLPDHRGADRRGRRGGAPASRGGDARRSGSARRCPSSSGTSRRTRHRTRTRSRTRSRRCTTRSCGWCTSCSGCGARTARTTGPCAAHCTALESPAAPDALWREALASWAAALADPACWAHAERRAKDLDDPRVSTATVAALRAALPAAHRGRERRPRRRGGHGRGRADGRPARGRAQVLAFSGGRRR